MNFYNHIKHWLKSRVHPLFPAVNYLLQKFTEVDKNKWMMRINLSFVLIVTAFLQFSFAANAQKVTLKEKSVALELIFKKIRVQTGYHVIWNESTIKNALPVSIDIKDTDLKLAMDKVLEGQSLTFTIKNKTIIVQAEKNSSSNKLNKNSVFNEIKGKVTDQKGLAIPGVTVRVKSSGKLVITDGNGSYTINAEATDVLQFSYIGFKPKEEIVGDRKSIDVTLLEDSGQLKEVMVTALGISKDTRKIGYAVSKVDGSLLNQAKEPNVAYSLQGRVPGLNISGVSGGPGSSARILIRGISNFTSTTGPLFVIDGVPMDNTQKGSANHYGGQDMGDGISSINPDDIENIVVLKGSTASALYGSRASNGVIQITTKSGKNQKGTTVEYNGNFNLNSMIDYTDYQKAYGHGTKGVRPMDKGELTAAGLNSWGDRLDGEPAISYDGNSYPYSAAKNQQSGYYRVAPVFTNTVSVTNGGEKSNFRFSLSHMNNQSILPNSGLTRYTANVNINHNITDKIKLAVMTNYVDETAKLRTNLSDMSRNANFTMGLLPVNIHPDYLKPGFDAITGYEWAMNADGYQGNPWFVANRLISDTQRKRLISSVSLRYDLNKSFYVQARGGYDFLNDHINKIEPTGIGYKRSGGIDELSKEQTYEMNADVLAGYTKQLSDKLSFDASAGASIRKYKSDYLGSKGNNFQQPFLYVLTNLATTSPIIKSPGARQTNSVYYTADISYDNYITLSTTGRYDEFSTTTKGIFTPSVSGSFIFSRLLDLPQLSLGKLRMSYAQTSGEAEPYKTSVYYSVSGVNQGETFGTMATDVIPETIMPYRMKEFEIGTELKGLNNRLQFDFTYFYRKTNREPIPKVLSTSTGYATSYEALGATKNQGIETLLSGTIIEQPDFSWKASFNHTSVNNKLLKIDDSPPLRKAQEGEYRPSVGPYSNGAFVASVQGLPIAQILAYDYKYDAKGNIVVDINGLPLRGEQVPMGSGLPKHYGGLNNDFNYKKFNLSFLIDYKFGLKVLSATDYLNTYYGLNKRTLTGRETGILVKGVTEDGAENTRIVNAEDYYKGLMTRVTAMSVFDGSFIKFRQITLGYTFLPKPSQKIFFRSMNVSVVARNLFTIMRHTDNFDPEASFSSLPGNAGLEGGGLPTTRMYGLNLNIKL